MDFKGFNCLSHSHWMLKSEVQKAFPVFILHVITQADSLMCQMHIMTYIHACVYTVASKRWWVHLHPLKTSWRNILLRFKDKIPQQNQFHCYPILWEKTKNFIWYLQWKNMETNQSLVKCGSRSEWVADVLLHLVNMWHKSWLDFYSHV